MAIKVPNFKPYSKTGLNKTAKIFSPVGARIYGAGQRGVTAKPFSKKWTNEVDKNVGKLMTVGSYKKGGKIKKTGIAKVHKGEVVVPKKIVRKKTYSQVAKSVRKTMGY